MNSIENCISIPTFGGFPNENLLFLTSPTSTKDVVQIQDQISDKTIQCHFRTST